MPQIKKAFVWFNVNTKSTLQYPFEFCSDVSFIDTIFSRNCHLLFVLSLLISDITFVFLLVSLFIFVQPDISNIFFSYHDWKQLFTQKCAAYYQKYLENRLNNFWTWNNSMLTKNHTGYSAEWIRIIWAPFSGQVSGTARLNCIKTLSGDSVFIRS